MAHRRSWSAARFWPCLGSSRNRIDELTAGSACRCAGLPGKREARPGIGGRSRFRPQVADGHLTTSCALGIAFAEERRGREDSDSNMRDDRDSRLQCTHRKPPSTTWSSSRVREWVVVRVVVRGRLPTMAPDFGSCARCARRSIWRLHFHNPGLGSGREAPLSLDCFEFSWRQSQLVQHSGVLQGLASPASQRACAPSHRRHTVQVFCRFLQPSSGIAQLAGLALPPQARWLR